MNEAQRVGANLRRARRELGWSLADAERNSDGSFTAVVIGSYERGDRNITAVRLLELASLYGMSPTQLVDADAPSDDDGAADGVDAITLNLDSLRSARAADGSLSDLARLAQTIIARRGDFNGTLLSLRRHDLQVLAASRGISTDALVALLVATGVVVEG